MNQKIAHGIMRLQYWFASYDRAAPEKKSAIASAAIEELAPVAIELIGSRRDRERADFVRQVAVQIVHSAGAGPRGLSTEDFEDLLSSRVAAIDRVVSRRAVDAASEEEGAGIVRGALGDFQETDSEASRVLEALDIAVERYRLAPTNEEKIHIALEFFSEAQLAG